MDMNSNPNPNNVHNVNGNGKDNGDSRPSWSFDTSWTVADGSLLTSVTVESSDSVIDDDDENDVKAVDSTIRSQPLILKPPSPDSGPCEIKISFTQKYEIRQVYVRSTARVYEIYYAPSLQASNEYLCTIRCSTAERDGETLQVTNVTRGSTWGLTEAKYTGEANSSSSEDDWVEVKVPESPLNENGISSLPNKTNINSGSSIQDLYEATAQISDADPCTSVTIRLLSLQNKCCVYVDEVYVFADPVDSSDQPVQIGSSTGSALMAMLVPTLMQFKSSAGQMHEKIASNKLKTDAEVESKSVDPANIADSTHQDEKLSVDQQNVNFNGTRAEPTEFHLPSHDPVMDRRDDPSVKNDLPLTRIEGLLEQLVSRVSRVEDFCSRFEENMLKPINSLDARLQRVEKQLEVLSKNSQYSDLPSSTRICAPSFSCGESNSSSIYDDSSRHTPPPEISESEKRDLPSADMSKLSNELPSSESIPHFLPSLVITAPEFSCGEDDEDNDVLKSSESTLEKSKWPLSIDDALAAALSGFISTSSNSYSEDTESLKVSASGCTSKATDNEFSDQTIVQTAHEFTTKENDNEEPSKFTEMLTITAPEFTMEGGDEEHSDYIHSHLVTASQSTDKDGNGSPSNEMLTVTAPEFTMEGGDEEHSDYIHSDLVTASQCTDKDGNGSQSNEVGNAEISSDACAMSGRESLLTDVSSAGCAKQNMMASPVVDEQCQSCEGKTIHSFEGDGDTCLAGLARGFGDTDNCQINGESGPMERCNDMPSVLNDGVKMLSGNQLEDRYDTPESAAESTECVAGEVSDRSALLNLTESLSPFVVDLEFPVLDVKFASHESSMTDSAFEALLRDVAGINIQIPPVQEVDEVIIDEQAYCTFTGDDKGADPLTSTILLLDLGINAEDVSSNLGSGVNDSSPSSNHPILASLI